MREPEESYLHLLELCLTGLATPKPLTATLQPGGGVDIRPLPSSELQKRFDGTEVWPADSFTMIGVRRLRNIRACVEDVLDKDVPGDLIEAGVWRGGAAIFMRALLSARSVSDRIVFAADSFQGLPAPDAERYPADVGHNFHLVGFLSVSLDEVKANFQRFGLLDEQDS